jgi:hypothetical protein
MSMNETAGYIVLVLIQGPNSIDCKCSLLWSTGLELAAGLIGATVVDANLTDAPFEAGASLSFNNVSKRVLVGSAITAILVCVHY